MRIYLGGYYSYVQVKTEYTWDPYHSRANGWHSCASLSNIELKNQW